MERAQLTAARVDNEWTLEQLAEQIGVHPATIERWEKGETFPQPVKLRKLCKKLGKTPEELGFGQEPLVVEDNTTKETEELEDTTGEGYLALRLFRCLWNYPRISTARYHELQELMILELRDNMMDIHELSRREAAKVLVTATLDYCGFSALKPIIKQPNDEILLQCGAGITACWYLRKGQEINFAAEAVAKFIPTLKEIAVSGSTTQRKEAAELLIP
jgi:transcriptional regulator with XRE-family HTH domain